MSKGNMMLGYARGKVGSLVFARRKGEQITRAYNSNPTNPKTTAQMQQRMKWANLVNIYKALQPELQKSFENLKEGQTSYNAFMSANLGADAVYLTKSQALQGGAKIAPYIVSRGSLGSFADGIRISLDIDAATTVAQLSADLLANNPTLMEGDQITAIILQNSFKDGAPLVTPLFFRIVLDSASAVLVADLNATSPVILESEDGILTPKQNANVLGINVAFYYAHAIIVSRTDANGLHVSNSRLVVAGTEPVAFKTTFAVAAESYGYVGDVYLDPQSYEAATVEVVPSVNGVTVDGKALGSTLTSYGSRTIAVSGQLFDEQAPTLTVNNTPVQLTIVSPELARGSFNFTENGTFAISATLGTSKVEGNIIVNYNAEDSNPL